MKKIISFILSIMAVFTICTVTTLQTFAENPIENGYEYIITSDGAVVVGCNNKVVVDFAVIPNTLGGMPVVKIAKDAFTSADIISIEIPASVKEIEHPAFGYYYNGYHKFLPGFTLKGVSGSCAETYAKTYDLVFKDLAKKEPTTEPPKEVHILGTIYGYFIVLDDPHTVATFREYVHDDEAVVADVNGNVISDSQDVGTGLKIELKTPVYDRYNYYTLMFYDVNGDGKVTAGDAREALRISAKLSEPDFVYFKAADINWDDKVTASDARTILRRAAKLE